MLTLAPTRELAMQIEVECQKFGMPLGIRSVCCYGGAPKGQRFSLKNLEHLECIISLTSRAGELSPKKRTQRAG